MTLESSRPFTTLELSTHGHIEWSGPMRKPKLPVRCRQRMSRYDYGQAGYYFLTLCVQQRRHLFGYGRSKRIRLSPAGRMVDATWVELIEHRPNTRLDAYVVMPNHFHAILAISSKDSQVSVSSIVRDFKSLTTTRYIIGVRHCGWVPFKGRLWQRGCHERVIRDERALRNIRRYIRNNPANWR